MSESGKSTYRQALEALSRSRAKIDTMKERGEEIVTEATRSTVSGVVGFTAGAADQFFGEADKETGIRMHKTNGAPTALIASGLMVGASMFGMFGKAAFVGYGTGDAGISHSFSTYGRMMGERLRLKAEKSEKEKAAPEGEKPAAQVNGKSESASKKLAKDATATEVAAAGGR